jgi:hypothetical protein
MSCLIHNPKLFVFFFNEPLNVVRLNNRKKLTICLSHFYMLKINSKAVFGVKWDYELSTGGRCIAWVLQNIDANYSLAAELSNSFCLC